MPVMLVEVTGIHIERALIGVQPNAVLTMHTMEDLLMVVSAKMD
jgi:hypothetical protein